MPEYIPKDLTRLNHPAPKKPQYAPHRWNAPAYVQRLHMAPDPDYSELLDQKGIKFIQTVVGIFLYYAQTLDPTMLRALNTPPPPAGSSRVLWPHGCPPPAQALIWLGLQLTPLSSICCTHDAGAHHFCLWLQLRRWSVQAGTLRRRLPLPSPSLHPAASSCLVAPRCPRHRLGAPWCFGWWVGFCPLPPAPVRPPPVGIGTLWGLPGFRLPWDLIFSAVRVVP